MPQIGKRTALAATGSPCWFARLAAISDESNDVSPARTRWRVPKEQRRGEWADGEATQIAQRSTCLRYRAFCSGLFGFTTLSSSGEYRDGGDFSPSLSANA